MDDLVDGMYKKLFNDILDYVKKDDKSVNTVAQLLFVSKYLERIGDHVTNICEWTIYAINGTYVDLNE